MTFTERATHPNQPRKFVLSPAGLENVIHIGNANRTGVYQPGTYGFEERLMYVSQSPLRDFLGSRIGTSSLLSSRHSEAQQRYSHGALSTYYLLRKQAERNGISLAKVTPNGINEYLQLNKWENQQRGRPDMDDFPFVDLGRQDPYLAQAIKRIDGSFDAQFGAFEVSMLLNGAFAHHIPVVSYANSFEEFEDLK